MKKGATDEEFLRLVMDPLSLNMQDTSGSSQEHRPLLDGKLREVVKNKDIKMLLEATTTETLREMIRYFRTFNICIPRILHELLKNSPEGMVMEHAGEVPGRQDNPNSPEQPGDDS